LRANDTLSCGCLLKYGLGGRKPTHGHTRWGKDGKKTTPEYRVWQSMLNRCRNPNLETWKYYGGKGITVCERWLVFENFLADMKSRPKGHTLHRIDADGNYEPSNCRWASFREQIRERNNQALIIYTPPPLPPLEGYRVKFKSEYADMEMGFGNMIKATQRAEQWRKEYPNAIITIELPRV
jgi:hypothetical protein